MAYQMSCGVSPVLEHIHPVAPEMHAVTPVHDPEAVVENSLLKMKTSMSDGTALANQVTEASQISETMCELEAHLGEVNTVGNGLSQPIAAVLSAAVEHFNQRLGFQFAPTPFAMEHYGEGMNRKAATGMAIESLGTTVKNIWTAIVKFFKRMINWLKGFFEDFKEGAKQLGERATLMNQEARKLGGKSFLVSIPEDKAGFIKALRQDGKILGRMEFAKAFETHLDSTAVKLDDMNHHARTMVKVTDLIKESLAASDATGADAVSQARRQINTIQKAAEDIGKSFKTSSNRDRKVPPYTQLLENRLPFGSMSQFMVMPRNNVSEMDAEIRLQAISNVEMYVAPSTGAETDRDVTGNVEALTLLSVISITEKIATAMKEGAKGDVLIKTLNEAVAFFDTTAAAFEKKDPDQERNDEAAKLASCVSKMITAYTTGFVAKTLMYEVGICKAALTYCSASMKPGVSTPMPQPKKPKDADKKAEKDKDAESTEEKDEKV